MKKSFLLSAFLLLTVISFVSCNKKTDDPERKDIISWIKPCVYAGESIGISSFNVKSDQGFLVAGTCYYADDTITQGIVRSYNANGDTVWTRKISIEGYYKCGISYVTENAAHEILLAGGYGHSYEHHFMMWLNGNGHIEKIVNYTVPDGYFCYGYKLFELANGHLCLAIAADKLNVPASGVAHEYAGAEAQFVVPKGFLLLEYFDAGGEFISLKSYENVITTPDKIIRLENGNLAVTGYMGMEMGSIDMIFMVIDQQGEIVTRNHFGNDAWDVGQSVCTDFSDGFLVSGNTTFSNVSVVYPVNSSGEEQPYKTYADSVYSYGTFLKKAQSGYMLFLQGAARLYFLKLDQQLQVNYLTWKDNYFSSSSFMDMQIHLMNDGSFAFLYLTDLGYSIIKTKPV